MSNEELKETKQLHKDMFDIAVKNEMEVDRLNNIITELEKILNEEVKGRYNGKENRLLNEGVQLYKSYIKDKLKELKGSDK